MFDFFLGENGVKNLYTYSIPIFAVFIFVEMFFSHINKAKLYQGKDFLMNITLALFNFGLDLLMKGIAMAVMFYFFNHSVFKFDFSIWYWLFCFVAVDFTYYVLHFLDHKSRFFWAVHITHHNSEFYNLTTGFRSSVFEPLYRYLFFSPLAFLGFNPWHIMVCYAIGQIYGVFVHTKTVNKLGILESILVTPSHHRVHHACNIKYLDKNMGTVFIFWDKIFGTFEAEDSKVPVKFGIYPKMPNENVATTVFYEWKKLIRDLKQPNLKFTDYVNYVFNSPGWRHDGKGKTVKDYQREYYLKKTKNQF